MAKTIPIPPVTVEITIASCKILVRGKRSGKGWIILETGGAKSVHLGFQPNKELALQFAHDACEPGTAATFTIRPST